MPGIPPPHRRRVRADHVAEQNIRSPGGPCGDIDKLYATLLTFAWRRLRNCGSPLRDAGPGRHCPVESRRGHVRWRTGPAAPAASDVLSWPLSPRSPSLRLSSPLIEQDVTISVIRLSGGFHERHSQARAAEVGQEPERLVPQRRRRRGTADSQARPARAGVGESGAQNDTDTDAPFIDSVERVRQTQRRDPRVAGEALQRQRAELGPSSPAGDLLAHQGSRATSVIHRRISDTLLGAAAPRGTADPRTVRAGLRGTGGRSARQSEARAG
jgi:hypothetical protein